MINFDTDGYILLIKTGDIMERIKYFLRQLLAGRYGVDRLNQTLIYIGIFLNIVLMFLQERQARAVISTLTISLLLFVVFRMMSRNINARYQENIKFLKLTKPIRAEVEIIKMRFQDRNEFKYVRCDKCRNVMRVPKGVGKIKIKCKNCGNEFIKRV